ncbi:hypothetical protein [Actinoplanes regularis]|uniref:hypothetical protein n=1 Tax=Actinoplanes regularis TaxID=52697 RepID=UPI0024A13C6B|nr:hypothetical protein [Actinoplanes regularis]GLW33339.1 hypothetical protein Areg01_62770 [Actinoplanes regularis]
MPEDDQELSTSTLRVGGWVPPVSATDPATKDPVTDSAQPALAPREALGQWAVSRLGTRAARRRALALAQRRGVVAGAAAVTVVLGVAGLLVTVTSRSEYPAVAQGALTELPATDAPPPAASSPSPSQSSASHAGASRSPASRPSPTRNNGTARPAPFQEYFEAESHHNVIAGKARSMPRDDASGGYLVRFVGDGEDNFLRFTGLTVPGSDTYNVQIRYISGEPRQATVLVNGRLFLENLTFPATVDWYTVGVLTLRIPLKDGANTIELRNDHEDAPDFDRIDVTR